jgi:hypothetical protein
MSRETTLFETGFLERLFVLGILKWQENKTSFNYMAITFSSFASF